VHFIIWLIKKTTGNNEERMKSKIIIWTVAFASIAVIVIILAHNKETMKNNIVNDDVSSYAVNVEEVKNTLIDREAKYIGLTEAVNDIELLSETQGKVLSVNTANGNRITKGSVLVQVDDEMLNANYRLAEASFEKAQNNTARCESLFKEGNISLSDVENARVTLKDAEAQYIIAKKHYNNACITSPINGIVVKRYVNIGSTVAPGTPIANIIDISRLKIVADIPESDIKRISRNMPVKISSDIYPGESFEGTVLSTGVKANDAHNYPVEILVNNNKGNFNAGMYLNVSFSFRSIKSILVIPRRALIGSIQSPKVFIVANGKALLKNILIYDSEGDLLLVKDGLSLGEKVIVSGQNNLENGVGVVLKNNNVK
jgi:membrane fusion protein, multidrug efflux system